MEDLIFFFGLVIGKLKWKCKTVTAQMTRLSGIAADNCVIQRGGVFFASSFPFFRAFRIEQVFLWVLQFSPLPRNQHSKFQFDSESEGYRFGIPYRL